MTLNFYSPKSRRLVFILFVLIPLVFSGTAFGKKKQASGRSARNQKSRKVSARATRSSRRGGRQVARGSRGRRGSARVSAREARRRAEAARRAAIARQMAIDKAMRDEVQTFISRDDLTGEDPEVRRVAVNA